MNYFELFDIPVQLKLDKFSLHKKFIALSRKYHPDYFAIQGLDKQAESLDITYYDQKDCWKNKKNTGCRLAF